MRLRTTIEFIGIWEQINNPDFNMVEFDQFKNASGSNAFVITATKWVKEQGRLVILNKEANREKELFNKNNVKPVKRIEKK